MTTAGRAILIGFMLTMAATRMSSAGAAEAASPPGAGDPASYFQAAILAGQWYLNNQNTDEHPWGTVQGSADQGRFVYEYYPATNVARANGVWGQALGIMG